MNPERMTAAEYRAAVAGARKAGARPAGRSSTGGGAWCCATCPGLEPFTTWTAVERHRDSTGHRRYTIPVHRTDPSTT